MQCLQLDYKRILLTLNITATRMPKNAHMPAAPIKNASPALCERGLLFLTLHEQLYVMDSPGTLAIAVGDRSATGPIVWILCEL